MPIAKDLLEKFSQAKNADDAIATWQPIAKELAEEKAEWLEEDALRPLVYNAVLRFDDGFYPVIAEEGKNLFDFVRKMVLREKRRIISDPNLRFLEVNAWEAYKDIQSKDTFYGRKLEKIKKRERAVYENKMKLHTDANKFYEEKKYWQVIKIILQEVDSESLLRKSLEANQVALAYSLVLLGCTVDKDYLPYLIELKWKNEFPARLKPVIEAYHTFQFSLYKAAIAGDAEAVRQLLSFPRHAQFRYYFYNNISNVNIFDAYNQSFFGALKTDSPALVELLGCHCSPLVSPNRFFDTLVNLEDAAKKQDKKKLYHFINDYLSSLPKNEIYRKIWKTRISLAIQRNDFQTIQNSFAVHDDFLAKIIFEVIDHEIEVMVEIQTLQQLSRAESDLLCKRVEDIIKQLPMLTKDELNALLFTSISLDSQNLFSAILFFNTEINSHNKNLHTVSQFLLLPCNGLTAERKQSWLSFLHERGADLYGLIHFAQALYDQYKILSQHNENLVKEVIILEQCIAYLMDKKLDEKFEEDLLIQKKMDEEKSQERVDEKSIELIDKKEKISFIAQQAPNVMHLEQSMRNNSSDYLKIKKGRVQQLFSFFACSSSKDQKLIDRTHHDKDSKSVLSRSWSIRK